MCYKRLLVAAATIVAPPLAAQSAIGFSSLVWRSPTGVAKMALEDNAFTVERVTPDSIRFSGTAFGYPAKGRLLTPRERLTAIVLELGAPGDSGALVFQSLRTAIIESYGIAMWDTGGGGENRPRRRRGVVDDAHWVMGDESGDWRITLEREHSRALLTFRLRGGQPVAVRQLRPDTAFAFAGLRWGASLAAARKSLATRGYQYAGTKGGDLHFQGKTFGLPSTVVLLGAGGRLAKIVVFVTPREREARNLYSDVKEHLRAKYGEPSGEVEKFEFAGVEGTYLEEAAIRTGAATFSTHWTAELDDGSYYLGLDITELDDDINVGIVYESPRWAAEAARRKKKSARDL